MGEDRHNMEDYEQTKATFSIEVPEYYNFGFDVIDAWAKKDRNKLAMIWANQNGEEKKFSFLDMSNLSNQAANVLLKYGINKGDRVFLMLPRIPEWWIFVIALIKLGAVYCPAPTMLTPRDIKYRINKGKFRMVITDLENAGKIEEICNECPTLSCPVCRGCRDQRLGKLALRVLYRLRSPTILSVFPTNGARKVPIRC